MGVLNEKRCKIKYVYLYIMGCDYYILKLLRVFYKDNEYLEFELEREKGYYDDYQFDEDADDFDEKLNEHIAMALTIKMDPITIYTNGRFNKSSCESKYKTLVENELIRYDKNWSDVIKIIKLEVRRER